MIGELLALLGSLLVLLAAIGLVRFSDPLARMHALAKASTFGALLLLAGAAVNLREVNDITSVVLAGLLHVMTSPPASNMISRATYLAGAMPRGPDIIDEGPAASRAGQDRSRTRTPPAAPDRGHRA